MFYKQKNDKGITLVALVITIIILIILSGISINMLIGEDGLITKAQQAKENIELARVQEQERLNELYSYINGDSFGYTTVQDIMEGSSSFRKRIADAITAAGVTTAESASDETFITNIGKIASTTLTVNYVTVSDGTVPIPKSFYYVGGNLATGVVISDNYNDSYEKNGRDMSAHSEVYGLQGNQFVWIPCSASNYYKRTYSGQVYDNKPYDTSTQSSELTQIKKYGGFYVARYEAGLGVTEKGAAANTSNQYDSAGVPTSKAGQIPWHFISWNQSQANAISMYNNNDYVTSGLITGTQWDVMIEKIYASDNTKSLTVGTAWGNYKNSDNFTYYGRYATYNNSTRQLSAFSSTMANGTDYENTYTLLTTGATDRNKGYNIYDVSGNLYEWTEENSFYNTENENRMLRGGGYNENGDTIPACYRLGSTSHTTLYSIGFRVVLYIK